MQGNDFFTLRVNPYNFGLVIQARLIPTKQTFSS